MIGAGGNIAHVVQSRVSADHVRKPNVEFESLGVEQCWVPFILLCAKSILQCGEGERRSNYARS